ncbi:MAG: cobalt-precorrin-5B (C(1))-methyltransferase [Nitrospirota bacterium]|nr:cobalt-precorrin-5B (C(1))-methyltransferase [Nitrospirota bacterium]
MRKGFTTGAAATAAAKAAAILLAGGQGLEGRSRRLTGFVEIQLPDGKKVCLKILNSELLTLNS